MYYNLQMRLYALVSFDFKIICFNVLLVDKKVNKQELLIYLCALIVMKL